MRPDRDAVGLVGLLPYCERDGRVYLPAFDALAIRCWTDHFVRTVLLKPRLEAEAVPEGWLSLEGEIVPRPIFRWSDGALPGLRARRQEVQRAVRAALPEVGLLYLRAPNWECSWAFGAARGSGTPVLLELHGDWETAFLAEWEAFPRSLLRRPVASWAAARTRTMAGEADVVCCVGEALRRKYAPGREAHLTTAHLVPEADFHRREDTCRGGTVHVLFVGELVPRKGVAFLVDAIASLRADGHDVVLDVVGDGPERGALEARADSAGLGGAVVFHGYRQHGGALLEHFRRADVFALPSIGAEGVPRVIQEAMASCCPVVATDVGSVRHQLGEGGLGAVVPPGDAGALARAIAGVVEDGPGRRAGIERAFEAARGHSLERQREAIRDLLHRCVDPALLRPVPGAESPGADRG